MDKRSLWRAMGPGLIFSGGAIGVSHLVQSTRAGALFGISMLLVILAINIIKYPYFRYGSTYAQATRRSLVAGFHELAPWTVLVFFLVTLATGPFVIAAVAASSGAVLLALLPIPLSTPVMATILLGMIGMLALAGRYPWVDRANRLFLFFLAVTTLIVTIVLLPRLDVAPMVDFSYLGAPAALFFLVALAGLMPAPLDATVGISLWTVAHNKREGERAPTLEETRTGYAIAYGFAVLMAFCFCIIGTVLLGQPGIEPAVAPPAFVGQLVSLYAEAVGDTAALLTGISALFVMLSSLLAASDAYARTLAASYAQWRVGSDDTKRHYAPMLGLSAIGAAVILFTLLDNFGVFIDFITSVAFLGAPLTAVLVYLVVTRCRLPDELRPSAAMRLFMLLGMALLFVLAAAFLLMQA